MQINLNMRKKENYKKCVICMENEGETETYKT